MTAKQTAMTEYREDVGGSITSRIDENGYLRVEGVAAKTGVLTYLLPDGTVRRELVNADTLFSEDSLDTLIGAPVTVEHPGTLSADNAQTYQRGSVPKAKADGGNLRVSIVVTGKDAIDQVRQGKQQLSPGYRTELDFTPGVFEGQNYDAVQVRRVYNHLAIVSSARGGPECRLHLDSLTADGLNCAVEVNPNQPTTDEVKPMPTVKLTSGATVEVADASTATALQGEINELSKRADAADAMVSKDKYDELQGKYDALQAELEKTKEDMKAKTNMDSDQIGDYIAVVESAKKLKADIEIKQDGAYLDATSIMAAAIGVDAKDKSPEYIKGRFDAALDLLSAENVRHQREINTDTVDTNALGVVEQHRAKFYGGKA